MMTMMMMRVLVTIPGAELTAVTTTGSGALGTSCSGFWPTNDKTISTDISIISYLRYVITIYQRMLGHDMTLTVAVQRRYILFIESLSHVSN